MSLWMFTNAARPFFSSNNDNRQFLAWHTFDNDFDIFPGTHQFKEYQREKEQKGGDKLRESIKASQQINHDLSESHLIDWSVAW